MQKDARCIVGVDIGGTFTDFVLFDKSRRLLLTDKQPTNNEDLASTVLQGLDLLLEKAELTYSNVEHILHATTLATNALIEKKGAKTALLCTKGHTDILEMRTGARYDIYDLNIQFHPPLIPRYLRFGITERILPNGDVYIPLDEEEVRSCVRQLVEDNGVQSIAVCLLHSYVNPSHEERVEKIIRQKYPDLYVSISSNVCPRISEYERTITTVVNAYVQPIIAEYIGTIMHELGKRGFSGGVYIMSCWGGLVETNVAKERPVLLLESGPAAGSQAAVYLAKRIVKQDIFSFDMGGTTAKGCVIREGLIEKDYKFEAARIHRYKAGSGIPVMVPTIKLIEIGGGGGSIAWIDGRGVIRVGPDSAGSFPGPACYGWGGDKPTITDADLVLGYINPDYFLGGRMKLRFDLAVDAIQRYIASKLGTDIYETAWAIYDKVNEDIAAAFRVHAAERGIDIRKFGLVTFGGAGPIHGATIGRKLGVRLVIVPMRAGIYSAFGLLTTPFEFSIDKSHFVMLADDGVAEYEQLIEKLTRQVSLQLKRIGIAEDRIHVTKKLSMRYKGQGFDIEVDYPNANGPLNTNMLRDAFENRYREIYMISNLSTEIEITGLRVTARGPILAPELYEYSWSPAEQGEPLKGSRTCYFSGRKQSLEPMATLVYNRYSLSPGMEIKGPAIIEEVESSCVIPPGFTARVDNLGNLLVEVY
ncbi:MAG: hydantoinase/oxoprolinase family protein [Candidatus Caldarchaeum sp.]